ncbi:MAG TPA: peptidoglycan editing factor PgeF [Chloroflexota bacterium]|nr:peptidoglycan editing factor PgeF [Chloroflexota bacterium]
MSLELFTFANLAALPGVVHGITTRAGGVSEGRCASLNTSYSVGDETERVDENLRRIEAAFDTRRKDVFSAYQVHGRAVTLVEQGTQSRPHCDVLVTRSPKKTLLLRYADCTPVLLADPKQRAVAAVHAGWRGSAVGAASAAVEAMVDAFGSRPGDIVAGIGPAIGPCCYEVGADVVQAFGPTREALFGDGKLDLWEANRQALLEAGVPAAQIEVAGICTKCQAEQFFSHRANNGQPAGRFAGLIRVV